MNYIKKSKFKLQSIGKKQITENSKTTTMNKIYLIIWITCLIIGIITNWR